MRLVAILILFASNDLVARYPLDSVAHKAATSMLLLCMDSLSRSCGGLLESVSRSLLSGFNIYLARHPGDRFIRLFLAKSAENKAISL